MNTSVDLIVIFIVKNIIHKDPYDAVKAVRVEINNNTNQISLSASSYNPLSCYLENTWLLIKYNKDPQLEVIGERL